MSKKIVNHWRRLLPGFAALIVLGLGLSGCGLRTAGGYAPTGTLAGPIAQVPSLQGAKIAVGSKSFTEGLILGKMVVILLQSAGADVRDYTNLPGSLSARRALIDDEVQIEMEYTGTAWIAYLRQEKPIPDARKQWEAVRDADAGNGLVWLPPAPMNNTYGLAVKRATAKKLGISRLSDLVKIPVEQRTICVNHEFAARSDGLQPLLRTYGVPLGAGVPEKNVRKLDSGAIFTAIADDLCTMAMVYTTDGRIKAGKLLVLQDDKSYFPKYNVAPVIGAATLKKYPQLRALLAPVTARLTDDALIEMNSRVDVDGLEPQQVAWEWLQAEGFVK